MDGLDKDELFTMLREHPSEIEVQYMIDQALSKFEAKRLPVCLAQHSPSEAHTSADAAQNTSQAAKEPQEEWIRLYVEAQVEEQLTRRLPQLVQDEVAKQLAALTRCSDATRTHADPTGSAMNSSPTRRPRPPLPLSPPRSPAAERTLQEPALVHYAASGSAALCASSTNVQGDVPEARVAAAAHTANEEDDEDEDDDDEDAEVVVRVREDTLSTALFSSAESPSRGGDESARVQREKILQAVRDVEHQVNALYRQVNEIAHVQRVARRRLAQLCGALEPAIDTARQSVSEADVVQQRGEDNSNKDMAVSSSATRTTATTTTTEVGVSDYASSLTASKERGVTSYGALYCGLMSALDACDAVRLRALLRRALHSVQATHEASTLYKVAEPACIATITNSVHVLQPSRSSSSSPFDSLSNNNNNNNVITNSGTIVVSDEILFEPVQLVKAEAHSEADKLLPVQQQQQQVCASESSSSGSSTNTAADDDDDAVVVAVEDKKTEAAKASEHANVQPPLASSSSPPPPPPSAPANIASPTTLAVVAVPRSSSNNNNNDVEEVTMASTQRSSFSSVSSQEYSLTSPAPRLPQLLSSFTSATRHSSVHAPLQLGADAVDVAAGLLPSFLGLRGAVCVRHVARNQLAHRSGIEPGDFVLAIAGVPVQSCAQLTKCLSSFCTVCGPERCSEVTLELFRPSTGRRQVIQLDLPKEP